MRRTLPKRKPGYSTLFDRIIVAIAILAGATIITKDETITAAQIVKTVW